MSKSINEPQRALDRANGIAEIGERIVIFIGILHIIIVYSNILFPDFLPIDMDTLRGSIMGVLLLWLSLGIRRRSGVIAVITLLAWGIDTLLKYVINSGIASGPLFTRSVIAIALLVGIVGCYMFRALSKSNENDSIPTISYARIITFSVLSVVGIMATVTLIF